jgi:hypothetical protein
MQWEIASHILETRPELEEVLEAETKMRNVATPASAICRARRRIMMQAVAGTSTLDRGADGTSGIRTIGA